MHNEISMLVNDDDDDVNKRWWEYATSSYKVEKQLMIVKSGKCKNSPRYISNVDFYLNKWCNGDPKDKHIQTASRNPVKPKLENTPMTQTHETRWMMACRGQVNCHLTSALVLGQF